MNSFSVQTVLPTAAYPANMPTSTPTALPPKIFVVEEPRIPFTTRLMQAAIISVACWMAYFYLFTGSEKSAYMAPVVDSGDMGLTPSEQAAATTVVYFSVAIAYVAYRAVSFIMTVLFWYQVLMVAGMAYQAYGEPLLCALLERLDHFVGGFLDQAPVPVPVAGDVVMVEPIMAESPVA